MAILTSFGEHNMFLRGAYMGVKLLDHVWANINLEQIISKNFSNMLCCS